jgi:hypothetical protein
LQTIFSHFQNSIFMKNRISFNPVEEFRKKYFGNLDELITMGVQILFGTNAEDMKGGQKMGDGGGVNFAHTGLKIAVDNPKFLDEETMSVEDFEHDANLSIFALEAEEKVATIVDQLNQVNILVGKDLMDQSNWVLDELRKRKDNPKYTALFERLNALYARRKERADATEKKIQKAIEKTLPKG